MASVLCADDFNARITALATAIATDINGIVTQYNANFTGIDAFEAATNTALAAIPGQIQALIQDAQTSGANVTWSIDKIENYVAASITAALNGISPSTMQVIQNIAAELAADTNSITTILRSLSRVVSYDAQSVSDADKAQARMNIGAQSAEDVSAAIAAAIAALPCPFMDHDFALEYTSRRTVVAH